MRVLLVVCCCLVGASAGIVSYPFGSLGYDTGYIGHPVTTLVSRPYVHPYPGSYSYQFVIGPSPFSHSLFPGSVVLTTVPEFIPFPPPMPNDKKGKGGKKSKDKKGEKDDGKDKKKDEKDDDKDKKDDAEDETEMPEKEKGNDEDDKKSEVEDLRE